MTPGACVFLSRLSLRCSVIELIGSEGKIRERVKRMRKRLDEEVRDQKQFLVRQLANPLENIFDERPQKPDYREILSWRRSAEAHSKQIGYRRESPLSEVH